MRKEENMQHRALIFCAMVIVIQVFSSQSNAADVRLTAMTYNLQHGEGTDGKLDLERIARVIDSVHPFYAALQEIDSVVDRTTDVDQAARYAELTGMFHAFARGIPLQGGAYGNAMLSRARPTNIRRVPLPGSEARVALFTDVDISNGADPQNATVTFISTHFMVGDAAAQLESAKIINNYVMNSANGDTNRPMMLLGDLNSSSGSGPITELRKVWSVGNFNYGIDWVFFRPEKRWRFLSARKPNTGDAAIASDHLPVETIMDLIVQPTGIVNGESGSESRNTAMNIQARAGGVWISYSADGRDNREMESPKLYIYDCSGKMVYGAWLDRASGSFVWNGCSSAGKRVKNGVYIVKISCGDSNIIKSAVLR